VVAVTGSDVQKWTPKSGTNLFGKGL